MCAFPRSDLAEKAALLASSGLYVGTSSWKYEGWLGLIYTPERYLTQGKLSRAKFEKTCLAEYAETFKTVRADAGYYQFSSAKMVKGYFSRVLSGFKLTIKMTQGCVPKTIYEVPSQIVAGS